MFDAGFPVGAVERRDPHPLHGLRVEATGVHAVAVGVRARDVERLHAADGAKKMLRRPGIEGVGGEVSFALLELELRAEEKGVVGVQDLVLHQVPKGYLRRKAATMPSTALRRRKSSAPTTR